MVLSKYGHILEFVQIQINYFDWEYKNAKALHQTARRYGKPVIVMEPVRGGMLANIPSPEVRSILDDASKKDGQPGASYASIALRYAEQLDGVLCTLSGMSSPEQMAENIADALGLPVSRVSVKATTEEGLGFTGSGEGISSQAITLLTEVENYCYDSEMMTQAAACGGCGGCGGCQAAPEADLK